MLTPGSRVEGYEIVRRAGRGATSEVYEARAPHRGQTVAVKILDEAFCLDADAIARFLNEARMLASFRHPRVVALFASGSLPAGPPFMVLEWLPEQLHRALDRAGGALTVRAAARAASQIAEGLAALHERGVVHRDLKPANVLLDGGDVTVAQLKLADLGLAKVYAGAGAEEASRSEDRLSLLPISTGNSALLGTYDYMAPEQWENPKKVDPKVDVYALGVLLFQVLTGALPFVAEEPKDLMVMHLFMDPPLHLLDAVVSPAGRDLVAQMLSKLPRSRPSMREVLDRLAALTSPEL